MGPTGATGSTGSTGATGGTGPVWSSDVVNTAAYTPPTRVGTPPACSTADVITGMTISVPANPGGITGTYKLVPNGTAMIDANTASDRLTGIEIDVDGTPPTNSIRAEFSTNTTEVFTVATTRTVTGLSAASTHTVTLLSCSNGNLMSVLANGASLSAIATG